MLMLMVLFQGRAGADGARGMPGEPGAKVRCLVLAVQCIILLRIQITDVFPVSVLGRSWF